MVKKNKIEFDRELEVDGHKIEFFSGIKSVNLSSEDLSKYFVKIIDPEGIERKLRLSNFISILWCSDVIMKSFKTEAEKFQTAGKINGRN